MENDWPKILWNFQKQVGKQVMENQPDIVVVDKVDKKTGVMDVAVHKDSNIRKKECEKVERMWGSKGNSGTHGH